MKGTGNARLVRDRNSKSVIVSLKGQSLSFLVFANITSSKRMSKKEEAIDLISSFEDESEKKRPATTSPGMMDVESEEDKEYSRRLLERHADFVSTVHIRQPKVRKTENNRIVSPPPSNNDTIQHFEWKRACPHPLSFAEYAEKNEWVLNCHIKVFGRLRKDTQPGLETNYVEVPFGTIPKGTQLPKGVSIKHNKEKQIVVFSNVVLDYFRKLGTLYLGIGLSPELVAMAWIFQLFKCITCDVSKA